MIWVGEEEDKRQNGTLHFKMNQIALGQLQKSHTYFLKREIPREISIWTWYEWANNEAKKGLWT